MPAPFDIQDYIRFVETAGGATKENLFELLGAVQDRFGYVPTEVIKDLAAKTSVSLSQIYGALTAYPGLETQPHKAK